MQKLKKNVKRRGRDKSRAVILELAKIRNQQTNLQTYSCTSTQQGVYNKRVCVCVNKQTIKHIQIKSKCNLLVFKHNNNNKYNRKIDRHFVIFHSRNLP